MRLVNAKSHRNDDVNSVMRQCFLWQGCSVHIPFRRERMKHNQCWLSISIPMIRKTNWHYCKGITIRTTKRSLKMKINCVQSSMKENKLYTISAKSPWKTH